MLGRVAAHHGDFPAAHDRYGEALRIERARGDTYRILVLHGDLGTAAAMQGRLEEAQAHFEMTLALARELDATSPIAQALDSLGELATRQGDHQRAIALLRESLVLARQLGEKTLLLFILGDLAKAEAARGEAVRAARLSGAEAGLRSAFTIPLPPVEVEGQTRARSHVREQLGAQRFERAWREGHAMDLVEVLAYALGEGMPGSFLVVRR
jgi:non-specific serine/threonine protein kinase